MRVRRVTSIGSGRRPRSIAHMPMGGHEQKSNFRIAALQFRAVSQAIRGTAVAAQRRQGG
jgi:hypothetical protein